MYPDHDCFSGPEFGELKFGKCRVSVFYHDDFLAHKTGNHPEHPRRLVVMRNSILDHPVNEYLDWIEPGLCREEDVLRCHTSIHFDQVKRASEAAEASPDGLVRLDPDTVVCPDSFRAAKRAVGACLEAVDLALDGTKRIAWCPVRPPGHHATSDRSMGFCLFNNIACAAAYALDTHNLERVMIVDYDLHHGNGTQDIFYESPGVLFTSIHQSYHFPGTGHIDEIGAGEGRGYTVNFPVLAGSGDHEFALYFREVVAPLAEQFKPQLLLISIGTDAHIADHLGFLQVSTEEYRRIALLLRAIATDLDIGLVFILEGGYSLEASVDAIVESLVASTVDTFDPGDLPTPDRPNPGVLETLDLLRKAHQGIWNF